MHNFSVKDKDARKLLGKRIKLARIELDLSQTDLGDLLMRDQMAISRIERGSVRLDWRDLDHIAVVLDKPLNYFLDGIAESKSSGGGESSPPLKKATGGKRRAA